jgi:hypothetical protein
MPLIFSRTLFEELKSASHVLGMLFEEFENASHVLRMLFEELKMLLTF